MPTIEMNKIIRNYLTSAVVYFSSIITSVSKYNYSFKKLGFCFIIYIRTTEPPVYISSVTYLNDLY